MEQVTPSRMKMERLRRGLTLDMLSRKCESKGVVANESTLSRIERDLQSPRPQLRVVLMKLLALEVTDFPMDERSAS